MASMGQAIQNKEKAQEILRRYRFDFVLGSLQYHPQNDVAYINFPTWMWMSSSPVTLRRYWSANGDADSLAFNLRCATSPDSTTLPCSATIPSSTKSCAALTQRVWDWKSTPPEYRGNRADSFPTLPSGSASWGGRDFDLRSDAHRAQDLGAGLDTAVEKWRRETGSYLPYLKNTEMHDAGLHLTCCGGTLMQTTNSKPFAPVALVQAQQYDPALAD